MSEKLNILITGTSTGFGRLTAQTLAKDGHTVFATMRGVDGRNQVHANSLRAWATSQGANLHILELDVTAQEQVDATVRAAYGIAGHLDVVINNAAVPNVGVLEGFTVEQAQQLFDVNFFGPYRLIKAVLPKMRQRGSGLLISVTSATGRIVIPFVAPYSATKFALEALAEEYAFELAPFGIESVILEPGSFGTEAFGKLMLADDEAVLAEYGEMAEIPVNNFQQMAAMLSNPDAPSPQLVADAIKGLVDTPQGKRPLRTVVGPLTVAGIEELNEDYLRARSKLYAEMDLGESESA